MLVHGYTEYEVDDNNVTLISRLDVSSPLYLHHDYVALTIVSVKLKGIENYKGWSCVMLLALEGKNKIGFIDGTCKMSNTDDFLMGLDDSYMQIRSSILSRETLPDVRSAYDTISSEESYQVVASSSSFGISQRSQTSAFVSNVPNRGNLQRKQSSGNVPRPFVTFIPNNSNNNKQGEGYGWSGSSSCFTDEQLSTLIKDNSLNGKNMQANMTTNQHMTHTDKELVDVYDISYLRIKASHPNETKAFISKIGNLKLSNGLTTYDVLDLNPKNVLRIGIQCGGLYYCSDQDPIQRISLTGFPAQSIGSSNTNVLDSPCFLVLNTVTSQSRQHDMSESDSSYHSD
ncbi:ribonuclease H-like domain-containing protein [Tanacetum coccineum]